MAPYSDGTSYPKRKTLDLLTWDTWAREGLAPPNSDTLLICRYCHHNLVANRSPEFLMEEAALDQWYARFRGSNMPSLKSVKEALSELNVCDLGLFEIMQVSDHPPDLRWQTKPMEDSLDLRQRLYSRSLPTPFKGVYLFTTHNGRVKITLGPLEKLFQEDACIARFADCDIAFVISTHAFLPATIKLRVFFVKDDKDDHLPGHSAYRFAIPTSRDTHRACSSIRHADVGEERREGLGMIVTDTLGTSKCKLSELQFWTAARAQSIK